MEFFSIDKILESYLLKGCEISMQRCCLRLRQGWGFTSYGQRSCQNDNEISIGTWHIFSAFDNVYFCSSYISVSLISEILDSFYIDIFRFTQEEKLDLIQNIFKWMNNGADVLQDQRCFILNFGFKQPLSFPEIKFILQRYFQSDTWREDRFNSKHFQVDE